MGGEVRYCTTSEGVRIAYSVRGEGPPLLICHHVYAFHLSHMAPALDDFLRRVGAGRQLIRYDMRGCGLSERNVDDMSPAAMLRDLEALVEHLGLEEFALLGADAGGPRSMEYAARHPDRVSRLVLYATFAAVPEVFPNAVLQTFAQLARVDWPLATRTFFDAGDRRSDEVLPWANMLQQSISGETMAKMIESHLNLDVSHLLGQIRCPTLVCHAMDDSYVGFGPGQRLAEAIPKARLVFLEGDPQATFAAVETAVEAIDRFLPVCETATAAAGAAGLDAGLTPRESEVLQLMASGRTSGEISRELSLSIRTVGRHITNIYNKIGARSRSDATSYAIRHGIARE